MSIPLSEGQFIQADDIPKQRLQSMAKMGFNTIHHAKLNDNTVVSLACDSYTHPSYISQSINTANTFAKKNAMVERLRAKLKNKQLMNK